MAAGPERHVRGAVGEQSRDGYGPFVPCRELIRHAENKDSTIGEGNERRTVDLTPDLGLTVRTESHIEIPGPGLRGWSDGQYEEPSEKCLVNGPSAIHWRLPS